MKYQPGFGRKMCRQGTQNHGITEELGLEKT